MELFTTSAGQEVWVHDKGTCKGDICPIHKPTTHHMRDWKMIFRYDRGIFERVCSHGVGHPDPDDQAAIKFITGEADGIHGCDSCCVDLDRQKLNL